jgi:predicted CopG family antitoxin
MTGYKTITIKEDAYIRLTNIAKRMGISRSNALELAIEKLPSKEINDRIAGLKGIQNMVKDVKVPYNSKITENDIDNSYFE